MAQKTTLKPFLSFIITCLFATNLGFGQIITFDFDTTFGNEVSFGSNYNDANLSPSTISRGSGLNAFNNANRFNSRSWAGASIANAIIGNDYVQFTISPISGYQFDVTNIVLNIQRSAVGLSGIAMRSSIDGYATNIDGEKAILDNTDITEIVTFTVNQSSLATAVTYRIYGYAEAGTGSGGFEGIGNDITINGSVIAIPPCGATPTTWFAGNWDNGTPDLSTPAVINDNYNTGTDGSFSACSLTVNAGFTLAINDVNNGSTTNDFIQILNDVIIDGTITMAPQAAFVQLNDNASMTGIGSARVDKETAPMNAWYEYTYWSSPVVGAEIGTALADSNPSRRFLFNAQNFLDTTSENNNNNGTFAGQDDIDDNGDDWQGLPGNTIMLPGVGYAATHSEAAFFGPPFSTPPYRFRYTFEGLFNNGEIFVPVYRNDSEPNDNNWNLIGNPYPSAIDADLFLAANANIDPSVLTNFTADGAIFLWSQNTAPSNTANGNEILNFSGSDYAIINGTGETAGGDGITPQRKIPSGQAFFISYAHTATPITTVGDISQGEIVFNNSMRVMNTSDNSQFFKNSNSKNSLLVANKLWFNLTSDNGVFNQTLIGYVNGATNNNDGAYFDAKKNESSGTSALLYTTIEGLNEKFAIQGKAENSLDLNETIKLGFKTTIKVATQYTLSVAQFQGDFLSNNTVYLKDNLLNKVHNLSDSDYTFTSEVGEFNERFVVMFSNQTLSTDAVVADADTLKIIDLDNNQVKFTTSNNLKIKTVSIFDLLGRALYKFKGQNSEETYNLASLKNTIYIAKVELSNGTIISKKAIKK